MATVSQPGYYNLQALTSLGALAAGYRLYTYSAGTTTHKAAYTDSAGSVAHSYTSDGVGGQYIALDARGELPAPLYLTSGSYDLCLKTSAGATVWTRQADPEGADLESSSGSALVGFIQSGTGAVARTVQAKLRDTVSVKDFGAVGDGSTDDTAAIQVALNYLSTLPAMSGAQGRLYFPVGVYVFSSTLKIPSNVFIYGNGVNFSTVLKPAASFTGTTAISIDGTNATGGYMFRINIEAITFDFSNMGSWSSPTTNTGLLIQDCYTIRLKDVFIYNAYGNIVYIKTSAATNNDVSFDSVHVYGSSTTNAPYGVRITQGNGVRLNNCDIENCNTNMSVSGTNTKVTASNLYSERHLVAVAYSATSASKLDMIGCNVMGTGGSQVGLSVTGDNCTVVGGYYEGGSGGIRTADASSKPANLQIIGAVYTNGDTKNWATNNLVTDSSGWHRTLLRNTKTLTSGAATTAFNLTVGYFSNGYVDVDVTATLTGVPYAQYTGRWRIPFASISASSVQTLTPTEYAKVNGTGSGNYTVAISVTTSLASNVMSVQVTGTSGGALGAGLTVDMRCEATLFQSADTGSTYMVSV